MPTWRLHGKKNIKDCLCLCPPCRDESFEHAPSKPHALPPLLADQAASAAHGARVFARRGDDFFILFHPSFAVRVTIEVAVDTVVHHFSLGPGVKFVQSFKVRVAAAYGGER